MLPPDINESQLRFTVEPEQGVRFGLTAIKNVGEGAIESLLDVRAKQGRITSLHALCEDLDLRLVNKRVFESLVKAGRVRLAGAARPGARRRCRRRRCGRGCLPPIDAACEHGARHQRDRNEGQAQLFGAFGDATPRRPAAAAASRCPTRRRGPRPSSSASRRRRSASTGAATRSIATRPS